MESVSSFTNPIDIGIVGAGKTKLVSQVIDDLNNSHDQILAYFYCNHNEESHRKPEEILRSFIKQFSVSNDEKAIHSSLLKIYNKRWQMGFSKELSLDECEVLLLELISTYPKTTLVLDALHECEERSRMSLFYCFNHLIEQSRNLKILISSRRDSNIMRQLKREANISIDDATNNQDDIARFVAEKISQNEKDRRYPISESLKSEIMEVLLKKSQGM